MVGMNSAETQNTYSEIFSNLGSTGNARLAFSSDNFCVQPPCYKERLISPLAYLLSLGPTLVGLAPFGAIPTGRVAIFIWPDRWRRRFHLGLRLATPPPPRTGPAARHVRTAVMMAPP